MPATMSPSAAPYGPRPRPRPVTTSAAPEAVSGPVAAPESGTYASPDQARGIAHQPGPGESAGGQTSPLGVNNRQESLMSYESPGTERRYPMGIEQLAQQASLSDLKHILKVRGIDTDSDAYDRAADLAIDLLVSAGHDMADKDVCGSDASDAMQTLLMAAFLRSDRLANLIERLVLSDRSH